MGFPSQTIISAELDYHEKGAMNALGYCDTATALGIDEFAQLIVQRSGERLTVSNIVR